MQEQCLCSLEVPPPLTGWQRERRSLGRLPDEDVAGIGSDLKCQGTRNSLACLNPPPGCYIIELTEWPDEFRGMWGRTPFTKAFISSFSFPR